MRRFFLISLLLSGFLVPIHAQTIPSKLSGTIIGTTEGYDYSTGTTSTVVNTAKAVFDGSLTTYLAAAQRSGGWAGLDLGSTHKITNIYYCPYITNPQRMVQGVFQGANRPDFMDATTLFTVTEQPATKILTAQSINSDKVFRYVRYIGPNDTRCNIAEAVFYGYKAIGDSTSKIDLPQLSNLPTIYIRTENGEDITSKDYYLEGDVFIVTDNGDSLFTDSLEIKGRGNYSWGTPKKPYRIKLNHKANLLGMPSHAKNWTLISNWGDKTLMRNLLAFDFSKRLEMPYTPAGIPVDVVLNGNYKGCYQLCDQMEVNPGRVEVEKVDEYSSAEDSIRGGYLIEMDAYAYNEAVMFYSNRGVPVTIKYPDEDEITQAQQDYIKSHFNLMESTLFSNTTKALSNYIDAGTFLRHFLVGEFSGNTDTYWSTYMYKHRSDDKFHFGPCWDFDLAYDNDNRTFPINGNSEIIRTGWVYNSGGSAAGGVREIVDKILTDSYTFKQLKTIWAQYRDQGIVSEYALHTVVDDYAEVLEASQQLNFARWPIMNEYVHQNPMIYGSYEGEVQNVKNYISNRILYIDRMLAYVPGTVNNPLTNTSDVHFWTKENTLYLAGLSDNVQVEILDLTGRRILTQVASGSLTVNLNKGIYIVRTGNTVLKCIIQ